ncbi:NAD(P)-binding oxidoreductase [Microbacterium sp. 22303]|uniref:NAD(P)-binding oxidoreductase n=1 Tax=Microbacterium sp. 22303 TaxID=3453905 RepID=UPI003F85A0F5
MRVFQIGAAGGVGRPLTRILTARGDRVSGMHRDPQQAHAIIDEGGTPIGGDLIDDRVEELAAKMAGHDAVVFSAGAHGTGIEQTTLIDGAGLEKAARAARQAGVRRFVLVSAFPDASRGQVPNPGFEHYMSVKKAADVYLSRTDLDWVIVRPGTLRNEPGDGLVTAGLAIDYGDVRRENVAAFIDAILHCPEVNRVIIEVTDGTMPAAKAVEQFL